MESLNIRIKEGINRYSNMNSGENSEFMKNLKIQKENLYTEFKIWLDNLKISMHHCKYRQVIAEIESKKNNFVLCSEYHWKYQYIEIDAILKLLRKKISNHKLDITVEGSHQHHSCLFWFNQIFLLLEQLVLEIRPDLNKKLDYNDINILRPIQCVIDSIIKFCFILLLFAQRNQQLSEILTYFSIVERIIPYMCYTRKTSTFLCLQKIQLFRVKILIENCEYLNAIEILEENIDSCFEYIKVLSDEDFNAYVFDLTDEKNKKYQEYLYRKRLFKNYQFRGVRKTLNKNEEEESTLKNNLIELSKQKSKIFPTKVDDKLIKISNNLSILDDKNLNINSNISNISNTSNLNENLNNDIKIISNNKSKIKDNKSTNIKKSESLVSINKSKNTKKNKSTKSNKNKSSNDENKKKNRNKIFTQLKPKKTLKQMEKEKKRIVEEVLGNIALNFYMRGAIFENVGNIDSALDAYKELEWFSIKFLTKKYPFFVKYMASLLNCAWNNYHIIYKIKFEKMKIKKENKIIKKIEQRKKREKIEAENRYNEEIIKFKSNRLLNDKKLNNFLESLGNKIYKEDEQRNFYIFNKFSKTGYILSTYKMIDDLLSDDFRPILKHMKKLEVTKQGEEVKDLVDKALIKKQQNSFFKDHNNNINNNKSYQTSNKYLNIINNSNANGKSSSIKKKESDNNINNSKIIVKNKYKIIKPNLIINKINKRRKARLATQIIGASNRYTSQSCEISNRNMKRSKSVCLYNDTSKRDTKVFLGASKTKREYQNLSQKFIKERNDSSISKYKTVISSLRISNKKEKVIKYKVDKENFNKILLKKKILLDKLSNKEYIFLRGLLKSKSLYPEVVKPIDDLELKRVREDADLTFNTKLELAKSGRGKKNLSNLISNSIGLNQSNNNKKLNLNRLETDENENKVLDNNEKLQQLENECFKIMSKRKLLIKKKNAFLNRSNFD